MPDLTRDGAVGNVAVGATTTVVLATSPNRKWVVLCNDSDEEIFLGIGCAAVQGKGIRISPVVATASADTYKIDANNQCTGPINAICASGSKSLSFAYGPA